MSDGGFEDPAVERLRLETVNGVPVFVVFICTCNICVDAPWPTPRPEFKNTVVDDTKLIGNIGPGVQV